MQPTITPDEFRDLRENYGLSQAKIAREIGLKRSYISQFENGRYQFSEPELLLLRSYLEDYYHEFMEDSKSELALPSISEASASPLDLDIEHCLVGINEILNRPVPKFLVFFDDDDELKIIRSELLQECVSLAKMCAEVRNQILANWDDPALVASRI